MLFVTIASLAVNIFFKFISPALLEFSLDRMQEMVLGVSLPIALLVVFEIVYRKTPYRVPAVAAGGESSIQGDGTAHGRLQGALAVKTIALSLLGVGSLIFILGLIASHGQAAVLIIASVIVMLGAALLLSSRSNKRAGR